jgi:hypothetical protein
MHIMTWDSTFRGRIFIYLDSAFLLRLPKSIFILFDERSCGILSSISFSNFAEIAPKTLCYIALVKEITAIAGVPFIDHPLRGLMLISKPYLSTNSGFKIIHICLIPFFNLRYTICNFSWIIC